MFASPRIITLIVLVAGSTCSKSSEPDQPTSQGVAPAKNASQVALPISRMDAALAPSPPGPGGMASNHVANKKISMKTVARLPKHHFVATPGYPGRGFRVGVFADDASWKAFQELEKLDIQPQFDSQVVAFVVLDAQTNALSFASLGPDDSEQVTLVVDWKGIEIAYEDVTPGVFVLVDRAKLERIRVSTSSDGKVADLATIDL